MFAYNEFVVVGPPSDVSDTHVGEAQLWKIAGVNPEGKWWYLKSGQGVVQTFLTAENLVPIR